MKSHSRVEMFRYTLLKPFKINHSVPVALLEVTTLASESQVLHPPKHRNNFLLPFEHLTIVGERDERPRGEAYMPPHAQGDGGPGDTMPPTEHRSPTKDKGSRSHTGFSRPPTRQGRPPSGQDRPPSRQQEDWHPKFDQALLLPRTELGNLLTEVKKKADLNQKPPPKTPDIGMHPQSRFGERDATVSMIPGPKDSKPQKYQELEQALANLKIGSKGKIYKGRSKPDQQQDDDTDTDRSVLQTSEHTNPFGQEEKLPTQPSESKFNLPLDIKFGLGKRRWSLDKPGVEIADDNNPKDINISPLAKGLAHEITEKWRTWADDPYTPTQSQAIHLPYAFKMVMQKGMLNNEGSLRAWNEKSADLSSLLGLLAVLHHEYQLRRKISDRFADQVINEIEREMQ
ncbi:uncharacterized protein DFL_003082 [Arthrobotrys flagrans]|uniref:Uncharacterized protein n=1 Tax=Arthrobotrys flagrans TaxID=97331 RepID=A0A437ACD0_ARTFL|nr:hypothetical protein DFL_003082 [Arthrobotrys flagrans]